MPDPLPVSADVDNILRSANYAGVRTLLNVENGADVTDTANVTAAGAVMNTGDQSVAGVKTFTSFPVTPSSAPTTDYQAANKKYVDDNAGGGSSYIAALFPRDNAPPAANFATIDTRNSKPCLDFDQTTEEISVFPFIIPDGIDLTSGIIARIRSAMSTATSGNIGWKVAFMRGTTDIDTDSFGADTSGSSAVSGTSGVPVTTEITCTDIDSMAAGELGFLRITRDTSVGSNATGDAELLGVDLRGAA